MIDVPKNKPKEIKTSNYSSTLISSKKIGCKVYNNQLKDNSEFGKENTRNKDTYFMKIKK